MVASGNAGLFVLTGIVAALVAALVTAVSCAGVTLAAVVAGFIAEKSGEPELVDSARCVCRAPWHVTGCDLAHRVTDAP